MIRKIFAVFFLLITLTVSSAFAKDDDVFTITSFGEGKITAQPDMARVVLSVKNHASDAKTTQAENARIANNVIAAVKSLGISAGDIKTARFSIYPTYAANSQKINGYFAENSLTIKIHGIEKVGQAIDAALSAGANQVSSVSFQIANAKSLEKEALALAVKDAREKAEITARALNVNIVGVKHASPNINRRAFETSSALLKSAANTSTPIEGGSVEVTATVNVEFIIK